MKVVLLLLALLGLSSGLQKGLEYHYRYNGRVATGITDLKHQFSGAGIHADVTVQVVDEHTALFQFSGIEVGDFHDELHCDMRAPLPIDYHPMEHDGLQYLNQAFKVTINESHVFEFMEVPTEPHWVTNIRKSVVNIFRFSPFGVLRPEAEVSESDHLSSLDFSTQEETMAGHCTNWYSIFKLPEEDTDTYNHDHELEDDAQREGGESGSLTGTKGPGGPKGSKSFKGRKGSKSSKGHKGSKTSGSPSRLTAGVPALDDTLWAVTRAIDFEHCEDYVSIKRRVTHETEHLITRSSVSSYIIRGHRNEMRIERVLVEGSITFHTTQDHHEHFDTFTNQTLELKVVRPIGDQLTFDYEPHRHTSWSYEVEDYSHDATYTPTLEQIVTEHKLTEADYTELKRIVISGIEELSDRMERNPTHRTSISKEMYHIVEALKYLDYHHLEEIHNKFDSEKVETSLSPSGYDTKKIYIFNEAMILSGYKQHINFLLHLFADQNRRHLYHDNVANFFKALPVIIKETSHIPQLQELVMQITWEHPEDQLKTQALLSYSTLVSNLCLHYERRSTHHEEHCDDHYRCDTQMILDTFLPYVKQGLDDAESPLWRRYIYLQAVTILNTPLVIDVLRPYVLGVKVQDVAFRTNAMWGLSQNVLPPTARGEVMDLLMPVFENIAEHPDVRTNAFLVMATWVPGVSWWQRMALATWHDSSHKVANFISTTIKTTAHMEDCGKLSEVTSRVEHLIKPAPPASITHSNNYYFLEFLHSHDHNKAVSFAWFANAASLLPSHIYFRILVVQYLGFTDEIKASVYQHDASRMILGGILKAHRDYFGKKPSEDALGIVMDMFNEIKEKLDFHAPEGPPNPWFNFEMNKDFLYIMSMQLMNHQRSSTPTPGYSLLHPPTFDRTTEAFIALPTDVGLPFVAIHTSDTAWWFNYRFVGTASPTKGTHKVTVDLGHHYKIEVMTHVPWSKKYAVGTGLEDSSNVLLPFTFHHSLDLKEKQIPGLELTLEPQTGDKVHLIHAHSLPYTIQHGEFPTALHQTDREFKVIRRFEESKYHRKSQHFPSDAGIWMEDEWKGDIPCPFTIRDMLRGKFSWRVPSLNVWEIDSIYDPEASTTKSVSITATYVSTDKRNSFGEVSGEIESFGQESQSPGGDYSDFSQFSQSSGSDYSEVQVQSASRQRIAMIQEQVVPASGAHVRSVSLDFDLQGNPQKKYAAVFTWASGATSTRRNTKFQFSWIKDVSEGVLAEPHSTCLNAQIEKPEFHPFDSVDEVLNKDFHSTFKIELHDGVNCDNSPVVDIQGSLDVSSEEMTKMRKMVTEDCDDHPRYYPIDLITSPVYDHIQYKVHWTEELPVEIKNFTYHTYDFIRGIYFPDIYYDYTVTNTDHKMEVDATKSIETEEWSIHITKPHEHSIIEHVKTPYLFNAVASPARIRDTLAYDFFNGREHQACVITQEKVRTYDGVEYPYHPDDCWNVISMDITEHQSGVAEVRFHDDHWETRVVLPDNGILMEMTKTSFKINGEDYKGDDDRIEVHHVNDGRILVVHLLTDVILKITDDKVYVLHDQIFRGKIHGICGNFDGEESAELVGPKGCIYHDYDLFVKSWTTPGEGCSGFGYLGRKRPVEEYQDACQHEAHIPTGVSYPEIVENDCTSWGFAEMTEGTLKCKSLVLTPTCKPHCHPIYVKSLPLLYDCEETDESSRLHHECFVHEKSTTVPGHCVH